MKNWTQRERKLLDILYEILIMTWMYKDTTFKGKSREEMAKWAQDKLNKAGYLNFPVGMSWGVLLEQDTFDKLKKIHEEYETSRGD